MINRVGCCPSCGSSWDGGEIIDVVSRMAVYANKYQHELEDIANIGYGWTTENKKHFSRVIVHEYNDVTYLQCPDIKCCKVFNTETGEVYASIYYARQGTPMSTEEETDYLPPIT